MPSASSKKTDPAARRGASWVEAQTPKTALELVADGFSPLLSGLLARRDVTGREAARVFLSPSVEDLHDPLLLNGMGEAVDRLMRARERGETVAIIGDYDVDGISATALLVAVFGACGLEVEAILPHRIRDGYGFQEHHVEMARDRGAMLIVTADCGSQSFVAAGKALDAGIDVIITDHHLTGSPHDSRVIHLNPHRPECSYPFPDLSGSGLAFKLATALAARVERPIEPELLLRVCCLGTIADMVPLRSENRTIASLGLDALPSTRSVGLRALLKVAGVGGAVRAGDVGFRLGPRINAAGRMASPDLALDLLLTRDRTEAEAIAAQLDEWNAERQRAEAAVVDEAGEIFAATAELPPILVAWSPAWHRGVVGIAAGRLSRRFHRPTVLMAVDGELATGSGRSIDGVHLHDFLHGWSARMERFGGHAQAVGLTVRVDRLEELKTEWLRSSNEWDPSLLVERHHYEQRLEAREVGDTLRLELEQLEPFGVGNPRPVFRLGPLTRSGHVRHFGTSHIALEATDESGDSIHLLGWRWADRADELGDRFEILGKITFDRFTRRTVVELVDARAIPTTA